MMTLLMICLFQSIGCDGVIGSKKTLDKCGVCGGNNTSCHIISGIFTRRSLPYGYNKVTTIPAGACHINVTEMRPSGNYLALKKTSGGYILNGNWALGYTNDYQGAGAVFKYHRPLPRDGHSPLEYIVANGPTNESLDVMILKQQDNRGIVYSYTIPTDKYTKHTGKEQPFVRHAAPPTVPQFISKEEYSSQVAAQGSGMIKAISQSLEGLKDPELQNDEPDLAYNQRYQAYIARLRRQQELNSRVRPEFQRGTAVAESRRATVLAGGGDTTASSDSDYRARLNAHRQRQRQLERRLREDTRLRHGRQKALSGRGLTAAGRNGTRPESILRKPGYVPYEAVAGRQVISPRRPTRTRIGSPNLSPKPGINYGLPSNRGIVPSIRQPVNPYVPQSLVPPPVGQQPILTAGHRQPPLSPAVPRPLPGAGHLLRPSGVSSQVGGANRQLFRPPVPPQARPQYPAPSTVYQQRGQALPQPFPNVNHPRYLAPNVVSPYKPAYGQYRSWLGQVQAQGLPGAVNDQIALNLPGSGRRPQLGIVDTSADYSWKITGFTECSRPCGEGEQKTVIVCVKVTSQAIVTDNNCDNALKPQTQSIPCNTHTCPPAWEVGSWGPCSTTCDRGQQTRTVECKQRVSKAVQLSVSATRCQHLRKPSIVKACNEDKLCVRWEVGDWSKCSSECGRGQRTRQVICVNADDQPIPENACTRTKPRASEVCDMGSCAKTWFYSEWSTECSAECGNGVYRRDVYCSADKDRCRAIDKPQSEKPCKSDIPCGGKWFTGPWDKVAKLHINWTLLTHVQNNSHYGHKTPPSGSRFYLMVHTPQLASDMSFDLLVRLFINGMFWSPQCTVTCGVGVMKRPVLCIKRLGKLMAIVDDENCLTDDKPDHTQPCQRAPCQPQWYTTDWTECSKSCGTGFKTREVKCLSADRRPSSLCDLTLKPDTRQTCNMLRCPKSRPDPGCKDRFDNCLLVVQARLCSYDYYKANCCLSCTSYEDHSKDA
ncbi:hypothetical protein LSH36_19g03030 [Paralvinella palmiformis]|uniref:PLAC domain-containing protein n=1 Tax=Paralvinella palmiformis TaxID=53620 RepID=A0AAD9KD00_9ANNE|nr:hypothetical protein LSH36_19g03030 [Paralvinella palmiformis]